MVLTSRVREDEAVSGKAAPTPEYPMAHLCSTCTHPRKKEIDEALKDGATLRDIAAQTGLSVSALHRHSRNHLAGQVQNEVTGLPDLELERKVDELESQVKGLTKNVRLIAEFLASRMR